MPFRSKQNLICTERNQGTRAHASEWSKDREVATVFADRIHDGYCGKRVAARSVEEEIQSLDIADPAQVVNHEGHQVPSDPGLVVLTVTRD